MDKRSIFLVYYRYDDDNIPENERPWLNWIASLVTGSPLIHVELEFSDGLCYGIVQDSSITKTQGKTYARNRYICQEIPVTIEQENRMRFFLETCMSKPSIFNYFGFYLLPLRPTSGRDNNAWFCSELLSTTLIEAGFDLGNVKPESISPAALYDIVEKRKIGFLRVMLRSEDKEYLF